MPPPIGVLCGRLCKGKTSQYLELIHAIYPKEGDSYMMGNVGKLTMYSLSNLDRLPQIGTHLEKRMKADWQAKHYGHVIIGFKIFDALITHSHADISLFRINIENILKLFLNKNQTHVMIKMAAIETLTKLISFLEENMLTSLVPLVEHVITMLTYQDKDPQPAFRVRIVALRSIGKIFPKMNFFASDRKSQILNGILENIYDVNETNYDLKPQSIESQKRDMFEKDLVLKSVDVSETATECLLSISKHTNISTISHFLLPILLYFDEKDFWNKKEFPIGVMKLILLFGGWKNGGYVLVFQLLNHIDLVKTTQNKIHIINVISVIIDKQNITGTVGSQALECLTAIIKLLYKSQGEPDFQKALFEAISNIAKRAEHSEQNITMMSSLVALFKKTQNEFDSEVLCKALLEISMYPSVVPEGKYYPESTITKPLLDESINKARKIEIRVLVWRILARLGKASQSKQEDSNKFYATFSKKQRDEIHYFLFKAAMMDDNTPQIYIEITLNFIQLLNQYRAKDLEQSLPIAFRLQELGTTNVIHSIIALYFHYVSVIFNNNDLTLVIQSVLSNRIKEKELASFEKFQFTEQVFPTDQQLMTIFAETKPVSILFEREKIVTILSKMESIKQVYPNIEVKELFSNLYSGDLIVKPIKTEYNPFQELDDHTDDASKRQSSSYTPLGEDVKNQQIEDVKKVDFFEIGLKSAERKHNLNILKNKLLKTGKEEKDDEAQSDTEDNMVEKKMIDDTTTFSLTNLQLPQLSLFTMIN
jgi:hypothetical protein